MAVTLTLVNSGVTRETSLILNNGDSLGDLTAHLYVNNHTPSVTDSVGAYTECTAPGYASLDLVGANWSLVTSAGACTATYPSFTETFTAGSGQTVYGVYLTDPTGALHSAGLLTTPFVIPSGGGSITLDLTYTHEQCP